MSAKILYERQGSTAHITVSNPAARNAMTWQMYRNLHDACETIDADPRVRVAVIRGAGDRAFVAGTDINQFVEFRGPADGVTYEARVEEVIDRLETLRVPTIAVVEGYAVGGGLVLAAACDLRIVTPNARFGLPIARTLGNCLSAATCARLVAVLGEVRTRQMVLMADLLDADQALLWGLANEVVAPEVLQPRVLELCDLLAAHAPLTMWAAKETLRRFRRSGLPDTSDLVRACYGSADFQEGMAAFLAKRPAVWEGR